MGHWVPRLLAAHNCHRQLPQRVAVKPLEARSPTRWQASKQGTRPVSCPQLAPPRDDPRHESAVQVAEQRRERHPQVGTLLQPRASAQRNQHVGQGLVTRSEPYRHHHVG
eukprot:1393501-Pyramimonas_sp.AAC.1